MANEEIVIDVSETGDVKVEGVGIAGPDCVKLTAGLEAALGTVTKRVKKPEFHRTATVARKAGV